ncbi:MAG: HAMP domain-containing sensor histidine kinase [Planctomycetota bacterium]
MSGPRRCEDLALLGHELRNPLAAALTGVAAAASITEAGDPRGDLLERAQRDLERLADLLNAYLDLLGGRLRQMVACDLGSLVRATASRRGAATVVVRTDGSVLRVRGNRALLARALENLIDNALRLGAGRIEVTTSLADDSAVVEVSDDGPGVPADLRARLFEPFVSGRGSTGLGLALVRDIAVAHGGTVRLLPSASGAHFELRLPLADRREASGIAAAGEHACAF